MIRIPIVSEFKDAGFKDAQKATKGLDTQFKQLARTAGIAFGAGAVVDFGRKAVNAAIDLEESVNAVNVTFGESSAAVLQLSEDAARSVGMSSAAFNSLSVELAGFAGQLTGDGQDISTVIESMTTRAADFASVMNISVSEAVGVFQSTLAGSSEVIRKYGVDVSAAAVEQYILGEGIADSKSEITEAMKVQGRYALLMEGTAKTAGDFANTSDSLANQQRILTAELENMSAQLGQQALPLLTDLADIALKAADAISDLDEATAKLPGSGGLFDALGDSLKIISGGWQDFTRDTLEAHAAEQEAADGIATTNAHLKLRADAYNTVHRQAVRALRAEAIALEDAAVAQAKYLKSIEHTVDAVGALQRSLSNQRNILDMADAFDQFRTVMDDADASTREQQQALIDLQLDVIDYATEVANLPDAVVTELIADLDRGALDEVQAFLEMIGDGITLPITPQVIEVPTGVAGTGAIRVDEFGNVRNVGSTTSNITVNMPAGANGDDVVQALQQWQRNNGAIPLYTSSAVGP